MNVNQRVKELIKEKIFTQAKLAELANVTPPTVSGHISKGDDLPSRYLTIICNAFPEISAEWLLRGEGEKFRGSAGNSFTMRDMKGGRGNTAGINNTTAPAYVDEKCWAELEKTRERYNNLEAKYFELVDRLLPKS